MGLSLTVQYAVSFGVTLIQQLFRFVEDIKSFSYPMTFVSIYFMLIPCLRDMQCFCKSEISNVVFSHMGHYIRGCLKVKGNEQMIFSPILVITPGVVSKEMNR